MSAKVAKLQDSLLEEEIQEDEDIIRTRNVKTRGSLLQRKQLAKEKESLNKTIRNNELMAQKLRNTKSLANEMDSGEDGNKSRNQINIKECLEKSRLIFRHRMEKKETWKPNEEETKFLKAQLKKNEFPIKEEKLAIISSFEQSFNYQIDINKLNAWLKKERRKAGKESSDDMVKNTYKKFSHEELRFLRENFAHNTYPKTEEMRAISKKLNVSLSKIENWYKHNRRSLAKKGFFVLKTKKYFKKEEINYLTKMFETHPRPNKQLVLEMAQNLECSESQIKNWYSNKRKKQKSLSKKQGSSKKINTKLEQLEIHSTPSLSSKDSKESLSSPLCDIPASINSVQSTNVPSLEKSPITLRPQIPQSQGFKIYSSNHRESALERSIPSLIIPTPCTLSSPIPQLKQSLLENYKLLSQEEKSLPLKDTITKINLMPKASPETSPSFLSSLSNKVQTSHISPSFGFHSSANISADISKLISPSSLNQLKNSLALLASKGKATLSPTNNSNIQSMINSSTLNNKVQKLGELEDSIRLKYLASLCSLNSGEKLFNTFAYPQTFNNPNYFLQPSSLLHTCLSEQVSKSIPLLSHSILSDLRSAENSEFRSRILEKDVEIRKV